jgi:hypothetical protein
MNPHDDCEGPSPCGARASDGDVYTYRLDDDEPTAMAIVHAVATALRRQPLDLEPLSAQIDPDALDDLLSGPVGRRDALSVSFRFEGCTVDVTPAEIRVRPPADDYE